MKRYIIPLSALVFALFSCEDYNDQFDIKTELTDVKEIVLTLEKSDYAIIAGNIDNKAIATGLDDQTTAYSDALAKVGSECCFNDMATADMYLPAYLASKYPYASEGSKYIVTYDNYVGPSAYMTDFSNIDSYTLDDEAYEAIWGNKVNASFLSPKSETKLAQLLNTNKLDASEGDMLIVNYAYSPTEPSIGGGTQTAEPTWTELSSIPVRAAGNNWNYVNSGAIDLSPYKGQTVNIGFKYTSTNSDAATWEIKNFKAASVPYLNVYAYARQQDGSFKKVTKNTDIKTGEYIFVAMDSDGKFYPWGRITDDKNYGYMAPPTMTISDNVINVGSADDYIVNIDSTTNGFTIKNAIDKYLYLSGTYDSYNVSAELPTDGAIWTITPTESDQFVIANATNGKCVKLNYYNGKYSFGAYADTKYNAVNYVQRTITNGDAEGFSVNDVELNSLSEVWTLDNKYGYKGTAYKDIAIPSESWLISPSFTIDENAALPYFSFDEAINKGSVSNLSVWVSTDYVSGNKALKATTVTPTKSEAYRFDGKNWTRYTNKDVKVAVLQPSDYTAIDDSKVSNPDMMLPIYLADKYPFAESNTNVVVLFVDSKDNYTATEYTLKDGTWTKVGTTASETTTFTQYAESIEANLSSFYENTLLGDEGGFTVQNVTLGDGLSYVWSITYSYGWKATGFNNTSNTKSEAYVISPVITLKKAQKPVLTFDEAHRYLNGADPTYYFEVLVSADYKGDATSCTWEKLTVPTWSDGQTWDYVNIGVIDLSKYSNQSIVIALKYKSDEVAAATWEFKNFRVVEESVLTQ